MRPRIPIGRVPAHPSTTPGRTSCWPWWTSVAPKFRWLTLLSRWFSPRFASPRRRSGARTRLRTSACARGRHRCSRQEQVRHWFFFFKQKTAYEIDGAREPTILIRNGLSIVSLYQYRNNLPEKFSKGLEDTGSAKAEVAADAKAALDQARLVGQPEGSAVYFGVDFNVNRASVDPVLEYFRAVGQTVGGRYAIG